MSKPDVSRHFDLAGMKVLVVEDEPEERELLPGRAPTVWRQRGTLNLSIPADGNAKQFQPKPVSKPVQSSAALSMANTIKEGIKTRKIVSSLRRVRCHRPFLHEKGFGRRGGSSKGCGSVTWTTEEL